MKINKCIITVNWNLAKNTNRFINLLLSLDEIENTQIYVINNTPEENDMFSLWENDPKVTIINSGKNVGYACGLNIGIEEALKDHEIEYFIITNNDVTVPQSLLKDFEKLDWQKSILSPIIVYENSTIIQNTGGRISYLIGGTINNNKNVPLDKMKAKKIDFLSGCMMMISREIIEVVGLFDADYLAYYEDVDYCVRVKSKGYNLKICDNIIIQHEHSGSTKDKLGFKHYLIAKNSIVFAKKNMNFPRKQVFIIMSIIRGFFQYISTPIQYAKGVWDGLQC